MKKPAERNFYEKLVNFCSQKSMRLTGKRKIIAETIANTDKHLDVIEIFERARKKDTRISLATIYRNLKLFEEAKLLEKHNFSGNRSTFEHAEKESHFHLIDIDTGKVIEFYDERIEKIKREIVDKKGYILINSKIELLGKRKK